MDKKQIGLRVKSLRAEKGMSQEALADMLKLDRSTLSKIENGEITPTARALFELKRIFSISTDWLLTGSGSREPLTSDDKEVNEMFNAVQKDTIVKHAVLGFFYKYKADNPELFKIIDKPGNPHYKEQKANIGVGK